MKTFHPATIRTLTIVTLATSLLTAQTTGDAKQSTPKEVLISKKSVNNRFAITSPVTGRAWQLGASKTTSGALSQSIAKAITQKLVQKKFILVQSLDFQCCSIQVEVLDASSQKPGLMLSSRITLLDVDKQSVYTKEYRVETQAAAGTDQISAAAAEVASAALADPNFMKALAGT